MAIFELIFDICLEVLLAILFGLSYGFNVGQPTRGDVLGAQGFPRIIIVIAFLLIAYQIVVLVRKMIKEKASNGGAESADNNRAGYLKLFICIALLVAYVFGMSIFGYALTTMLFVFAFARTIGYKKYLKLLIFTVVITVILVLVFGTLFSIALPRGKWFFKEISYYWY